MKRNTLKKTVAFVLAMTLVTGGMPVNVPSFLTGGTEIVARAGSEGAYQEAAWNGTSVVYTAKTATSPTTLANDTTAWTDGNWYVVPAGGVEISSRITVTGTVNLILTDGATLTAPKGITVATGNTLNIYAQSEGENAGSLLINGVEDKSAGIGGARGAANCGAVNIHGGKITTIGAGNGAGIGGFWKGNGGNITIYGGTVEAVGGLYGAGIGGGQPENGNGGSGGTVTIYGGTVTAKGSTDGGAGIGGGFRGGSGGTVTIHGGTVTAIGGASSMGIGGVCGRVRNQDDPRPGSYTIIPPKNASLTIGRGLKVYGGSSANPTTEITQERLSQIYNENYNETTVYEYMIVSAPAHTHNFTYSADGDTITATCGADGCTLDDGSGNHTATLTIAPPPHTLVFDENDANAVITDANNIKGNAVVSYYATDTNGNKTGDALTSAPTAEGKYWAEITLGTESNTATAHVVYDITNPEYDITFPTNLENGTMTAKIGDTVVTKAHYGDTITLVATPNDGYALNYIQYKQSDGRMTELTGTDNICTFTMPKDNLKIVAVNFREKSNAGATVTTTGDGGTASLMKNDYSELKSTDQVTEGDTFVLCVNKEDDYYFKVPGIDMTEFTEDEYKAYMEYAEENSISVSANTVLYHVTMPYVASGDLNVNVEFAKAQTFTILYQPSTQPTTDVWCKFSKTVDSQEKTFTVKMDPDAKMGSNTVYAVKLSAPFNPEKVAFGTSEEALETADMSTASVSEAETWTTITGGQYLIVGGNAKTAIVSFNHDGSSEYQIVICKPDDSGVVTGKVTTPAAPTKEGYNFVAWRGYEGIEEVNRSANTEISVNESMVFTAVWQPAELNVTLNLNGGAGGSNVTSVAYRQALTISDNPTRNGYAFDGWTVAKTVTEDGKLFVKGTPFDLSTPITADLELDAQWKHEHSYSCYQISQFPSLKKYQKYESAVHIAVCGCEDVELVAHEFDSNGKCACGYQIPTSDDAKLEVSYGKMESGNYIAKMTELPEQKKKNQEVSVSAPSNWGSLTFSKWQYSTDDGNTWEDAGAYTMMSFAIPCDMKMRAVYVNAITKPEVSMSATTYATTAANRDELYNSILYQMNYKLPDGYTYVDSGVRAGDNAGISYYELKEKRASMDGEAKAITYGIAAAMSVLQGELTTFDTSASWQYYAKRENNVLDESGMNAAKLGEYMYLSKPINIKDEPLYWNYKPNTKSQSGSINALIPVGFAQRNNGNHYIYAIAWLRYKDKDGNIQTIYTNALPTTLNGIASCRPVSKNGNE